MSSKHEPLIAVVGAAGQQGSGVVRALEAGRQFKVRALSRNPGRHRGLADEVLKADLDRPGTLAAAFAGAHGVFLVTNFWEEGTDEVKQATAAARAARDAGVEHLNRKGHHFSVDQVPKEVFALSPGGAEIAETFSYFQAHTYLGSDSYDRIALADKIAGRPPTRFPAWARANFPAQTA